MELKFAESVNILGEIYTIELKDKDPGFTGEHAGAYGYINEAKKKIILRDRSDWPIFKEENRRDELEIWTKKTLRHEIVHAFLFESGLNGSTSCGRAWAKNEEMVDWMAIQGPKLIKAWEESGAL